MERTTKKKYKTPMPSTLRPESFKVAEAKNTREFIFVGLLMCFTVSIVSAIMGDRDKKPSPALNARSNNPIALSKLTKVDEPSASTLPSSEVTMLHIKGIYEEGKNIAFSMNNLDSGAEYQLDFGDGNIVKVTDSHVMHKYRTPGKYLVVLTIDYDGKKKILEQRKLSILKGIDIHPVSKREY